MSSSRVTGDRPQGAGQRARITGGVQRGGEGRQRPAAGELPVAWSTPPPAPAATTRPPARHEGGGRAGSSAVSVPMSPRHAVRRLDGADDGERPPTARRSSDGRRATPRAADAPHRTTPARRPRPRSSTRATLEHLREHGLAGDQQGAVRAGRPAHGVEERVVHDRQAGARGRRPPRPPPQPSRRRRPDTAASRPSSTTGRSGVTTVASPRTTAGPPSHPAQSGANQRRPDATSRRPDRRRRPGPDGKRPGGQQRAPGEQTHHAGRGRHVGVGRDEWIRLGGTRWTTRAPTPTATTSAPIRAGPRRVEERPATGTAAAMLASVAPNGADTTAVSHRSAVPDLRWWLRWRHGRGRRVSVAPTPGRGSAMRFPRTSASVLLARARGHRLHCRRGRQGRRRGWRADPEPRLGGAARSPGQPGRRVLRRTGRVRLRRPAAGRRRAGTSATENRPGTRSRLSRSSTGHPTSGSSPPGRGTASASRRCRRCRRPFVVTS